MTHFSDQGPRVDASFGFKAPSTKAHAELRRELAELEERKGTWSPTDIARYCLIQDELQGRMQKFKQIVKVIDGDKE